MRPVHVNLAVAAAMLGIFVSCDHETPTLETEEPPGLETEKGIAEPRPAPMGSLGGPCGINYVKCPTEGDVGRVFRELKKTSVKTAVNASQTDRACNPSIEWSTPHEGALKQPTRSSRIAI